MSRFGGVEVLDHLCALVEGRFEKNTGEFSLARFVDFQMVLLPHIGDGNNVLQRRFTAKLAKKVEIPYGDPAKAIVGDAMDVDDPGERSPILISVEKFSPEGRETASGDVCLRVGQEICDQLQNLRIAHCSVIESRGVDEGHRSSVESEFVR